jgi:hypothetical protein
MVSCAAVEVRKGARSLTRFWVSFESGAGEVWDGVYR